MPLKHLLVHLDGSERAVARLDLAVKVAEREGSGLAGLFAEQRIVARSRSKRAVNGRRSAADVARLFSERTRSVRGGTEWWQIPNGEFDVAGIAARYARYADLSIVGQPDPEDVCVPPDLAEQLFLESGRPVLVIPAAGRYPDVGRKVIIAWDGSRESARALNDALPLLANVKVAKVALLRGPRDRVAREDLSTPSILRHLARHGVEAEYEVLVVDPRGRGPDALGAVLNLGADMGADLIVTGGRGKHGTPFPKAGRRSRATFAEMTAPVLISL